MKKLNLNKVYDLENPPFEECPYCNSAIFYKKESCCGKYNFYFSYKEKENVDNCAMYDGLTCKNVGKYVYCSECNKRLFKYR